MKLILGALCTILVIVNLTDAYPARSNYYYPRSYMLGGSVYSNPRYVREGGYEYIPPNTMTAMVIGDTVATNSFSGQPQFQQKRPVVVALPEEEPDQEQQHHEPEQVTEKNQAVFVSQEEESVNETEPENEQHAEQETLFSLEESSSDASVVSTTRATPVTHKAVKKVKTGKAKRPVVVPAQPEEEEEEQDEHDEFGASWPFGGARRGGIPSYNAFFPVFIGGSSPSSRSRTRSSESDEVHVPGSATAIANAFSTGKGGVATSHATSFGDPYAAAMFRNAGLFRTKNRKQHISESEE